jgi:hypothetical protein
MTPARFSLLFSGALVLALAMPAHAQRYPGGWGGRGTWAGDDARVATQGNAEPSRHIEVDTFRAADAGDALGHGRIVVVGTPPVAPPPAEAMPDHLPGNADAPTPEDKLPVYEAAVIDQLGARGYDIANAADPRQLVEVTVSHDVVVPEEAPHRPVSGEVSMGVSNRGSGFGGALFIDLSKPRKAIIATRLEVRIRDKASGRVLWEGHAEGQARMGEGGFDDTRMASRLAGALFAKFPEGKVVAVLPDAERQAAAGE